MLNRFESVYLLYQRLQMGRGGAAATAHHAHAVLGGEIEEGLGKRFGFKRINCLAVHVEGKASVGNAGDGQGRVLTEEFDRLTHQVRAGGTVEADHING
ncbi:hypothetical protein SDC9_185940 [bioreactor metagenome]|uniref:Uncharacterized protein n=1 Tax=bioreactor metagenome TaxID=1076179 RepID=A0A645HIH9_9ZZZZ